MNTSEIGFWLALVVAIASLAACLGSSVGVFLGALDPDSFKTTFLASSVAWFAAAAFLSIRRARVP